MRRALALVLPALLLAACDTTFPWSKGESNDPKVQLSAPSVSFAAFPGGAGGTRAVTIAASGVGVAGLGFAASGGAVPSWLTVDLATVSAGPALVLSVSAAPATSGTYTTTLRVYALDSANRPLAVASLPVSLEVIPTPTAAPSPVTLSWVEGQSPAPLAVTITHDPRVALGAVTIDVPWLSVSRSGDVITVAPNASTAALPSGAATGLLQVQAVLAAGIVTLPIPVQVNVASALAGPASLAFTVGPATVAQDLVSTTTVTAPGAALAFTAAASVPWLRATGGTTGAAGNLTVSVVQAELGSLLNGAHTGTITLTAAGRSPLAIPVTLTIGLPEVLSVGPVAFSDTADTDYVVVRGSGFSAPGAAVTVGGAAPASQTVVNDTTLQVVPGARAAGDYPVATANALGLTRSSATLHVVDPPPYTATSITHTFGDQERLVASARHRAVFACRCYFCGFSSTGTSSTVQRFRYDAGTGTWIGSTHGYPNLWDAVLTPDEQWLVVLTSTDLRLVDPATMVTARTITLPRAPSGTSRQLSATNDGLVMVQTLRQAWSFRTETFVSLPWMVYDLGLATSVDGSRVFLGDANNYSSNPYRLYDATTGTATTTSTFMHYSRGLLSRHGERALVNSYLLDQNLTLLWQNLQVVSHTGDLSPDGTRAYGYATSPSRVQRVDLTGSPPYPELTAIPVTSPGSYVRAVTDPSGDFVFLVGDQRFVVVDVR